MMPLIRKGQQLKVRFSDWRDVRAGDVVVFDAEGALCVHRCMRMSRAAHNIYCHTKADSCFFLDAPFPAQRIVGIVEFTSFYLIAANHVCALFHCSAYLLLRLRAYVRILLRLPAV